VSRQRYRFRFSPTINLLIAGESGGPNSALQMLHTRGLISLDEKWVGQIASVLSHIMEIHVTHRGASDA